MLKTGMPAKIHDIRNGERLRASIQYHE